MSAIELRGGLFVDARAIALAIALAPLCYDMDVASSGLMNQSESRFPYRLRHPHQGPSRGTMMPTKQCERCGLDFHASKKSARFCSKRCSNRRPGTAQEIRSCAFCGNDFAFTQYPSTLTRHNRGLFCSLSCSRKYRIGPLNHTWRGGRCNNADGRTLIYAPDHPDARQGRGRYIYEYRLVAEQLIGRPLRRDEVVHHINGIHTDNRPDNLMVMTPSEHKKLHQKQDNAYRETLTQRLCSDCFQWKDISDMCANHRFRCKACHAQRERISRESH